MLSLGTSIHSRALDLTRLTVEMTAEAGSGHPTPASSLAHLALSAPDIASAALELLAKGQTLERE